MADECTKCIKLEEFQRIWDYNKEEKESRKTTDKIVYEVKAGQDQFQFIMKDIQEKVAAQALATEKRETAAALANERSQDIIVQNHKENQQQFQEINNRRIADAQIVADKKEAADKAAALEEKEKAKEKVRLAELKAAQDEARRIEKVAQDEARRIEKKADKKAKLVQTFALIGIALGLLGNLVIGILVKWAPASVNLPIGK